MDPTQNPTPAPAAPDAGQGGSPGETVQLSAAEYRALQDAARSGQESRQTMAERLASLESQYRAEKVNATLGDVLAGQQFVNPTAAAQARQILAARAEVRTVDGAPAVVDRATGRPFTEAAAEALRSGEFNHFLAASNRGGSGATNFPPPGAGTPQQPMGQNPAEAALFAAFGPRVAQTPGIPGFGPRGM